MFGNPGNQAASDTAVKKQLSTGTKATAMSQEWRDQTQVPREDGKLNCHSVAARQCSQLRIE